MLIYHFCELKSTRYIATLDCEIHMHTHTDCDSDRESEQCEQEREKETHTWHLKANDSCVMCNAYSVYKLLNCNGQNERVVGAKNYIVAIQQ